MKQHFFNLAAALSLVLCVATAALCVRSYFIAEVFSIIKQEPPPRGYAADTWRYYRLISGQGGIAFQRQAWKDGGQGIHKLGSVSPPSDLGIAVDQLNKAGLWHYPFKQVTYPVLPFDQGHYPSRFTFCGFQWAHGGYDDGMDMWRCASLTLPLPVLVILFAALPGTWLVRRRRTGLRRSRQLCRDCGYDLRATPERCPECGTEPLSRPAPPAPCAPRRGT